MVNTVCAGSAGFLLAFALLETGMVMPETAYLRRRYISARASSSVSDGTASQSMAARRDCERGQHEDAVSTARACWTAARATGSALKLARRPGRAR
jgi:hypothetical protein